MESFSSVRWHYDETLFDNYQTNFSRRIKWNFSLSSAFFLLWWDHHQKSWRILELFFQIVVASAKVVYDYDDKSDEELLEPPKLEKSVEIKKSVQSSSSETVESEIKLFDEQSDEVAPKVDFDSASNSKAKLDDDDFDTDLFNDMLDIQGDDPVADISEKDRLKPITDNNDKDDDLSEGLDDEKMADEGVNDTENSEGEGERETKDSGNSASSFSLNFTSSALLVILIFLQSYV